MDNINWEGVAKDILEQEKILGSCNYPEPIFVLVIQKDNVYIGSIQKVVPEFSDEIVMLSKSSCELHGDLVRAIRKLDDKRLELVADDNLDLCGRQHILRRLEDKLVCMTTEQAGYISDYPPKVIEI